MISNQNIFFTRFWWQTTTIMIKKKKTFKNGNLKKFLIYAQRHYVGKSF